MPQNRVSDIITHVTLNTINNVANCMTAIYMINETFSLKARITLMFATTTMIYKVRCPTSTCLNEEVDSFQWS